MSRRRRIRRTRQWIVSGFFFCISFPFHPHSLSISPRYNNNARDQTSLAGVHAPIYYIVPVEPRRTILADLFYARARSSPSPLYSTAGPTTIFRGSVSFLFLFFFFTSVFFVIKATSRKLVDAKTTVSTRAPFSRSRFFSGVVSRENDSTTAKNNFFREHSTPTKFCSNKIRIYFGLYRPSTFTIRGPYKCIVCLPN